MPRLEVGGAALGWGECKNSRMRASGLGKLRSHVLWEGLSESSLPSRSAVRSQAEVRARGRLRTKANGGVRGKEEEEEQKDEEEEGGKKE